jgi:hypothetical protein
MKFTSLIWFVLLFLRHPCKNIHVLNENSFSLLRIGSRKAKCFVIQFGLVSTDSVSFAWLKRNNFPTPISTKFLVRTSYPKTNRYCDMPVYRDWSTAQGRPYMIEFIHSAVYLTAGPYPILKRVIYRLRASPSSFSFRYTLVCLRPSRICLRLLPRPPVTSIHFSIFPSITCFRRQFLRRCDQSS